MNSLFIRKFCLFAIGLLVSGAEYASAAPAISGSYEVVSKSQLPAGATVVLRFHLINHGTKPISVDRIFLWDLGRPVRSAGSAAITLSPGASEETTREFTLSAALFQRWRQSRSPQVVLNLRTPAGIRVAQTIRLERTSAGRGE